MNEEEPWTVKGRNRDRLKIARVALRDREYRWAWFFLWTCIPESEAWIAYVWLWAIPIICVPTLAHFL